MIRFTLFLFFLILTSCGNDEPYFIDGLSSSPINSCNKIDERLMMEVIIDDLDWIDYLDLKHIKEKRNSRATGQIRIPLINAACTAFLVNKNTIMTNNHCVPTSLYASGLKLFMRNEDNSRTAYFCERLLVTNASLDFSLLECEDYPGDVYGSIALSMSTPSLNQSMYVIQENCDYINEPRCTVQKYLAKGVIRGLSLNSIGHDADTLGGSSGSPLFSQKNHELLGIHHAGRSRTPSAPALNFAIPISRIASFLSINHPEIEINRAADQGDEPQVILDQCIP